MMLRPAAVIAGLSLLTACGATAQGPASTPMASYDAKRAADTPVGETKYGTSRHPAWFCSSTDKYTCRILKAGKITITGPGGGGRLGEYYYAASLNDGKETGFVDSLGWISLQTDDERKKAVAEAASCDRKGGVRVGMTKQQVLATCWGKPSRVNTTTTASGTREQWVYGLRSYLYFDESGRLTTIQN